MKLKKIMMSTAVTLSLVGTSVAPVIANASNNQSTNQQENIQTKIDNKKGKEENIIINSLLDSQSKINSVVKQSHPKNKKSAQYKRDYLSNDNQISSKPSEINALKDNMNKSWINTIKNNKMSSKQQLKAIEKETNEMKKLGSHNHAANVGKTIAKKINNGQI